MLSKKLNLYLGWCQLIRICVCRINLFIRSAFQRHLFADLYPYGVLIFLSEIFLQCTRNIAGPKFGRTFRARNDTLRREIVKKIGEN